MSVNRHPNTQGVTIKQWRYTATGGETTLSGTDGFSQSLTYTAGAEEVFINGVLLVRGTDYTATTGTTVVLNNALVAGDIATVSAPSVFNVANTVPLATVAAKGDLIVGNGAASVTNLGVGADGSTLVANSSAGGGISWAGPTFMAGKNKMLNGAMDIWQRGTSTAIAYGLSRSGADRFYTNSDSSLTGTSSQQAFTAGTAPVAGYEGTYFLRQNITATSGGTFIVVVGQDIENVRTLAGQTATLSFWAKADASRTYSLSAQQNFGSGGSSATYTSTTFTIGTTWSRITTTFTFPSVAGKTIGAGSYITIAIVSPSVTAQTLDTWGFQLEAGSVATPFTTATGTLQGELSACMRYYEQSYDIGTAIGTNTQNGQVTFRGLGYSASSSGGSPTTAIWNEITIPYEVKKRIPATVTIYSSYTGTAGKFRNYDGSTDLAGYSIDGNGQQAFTFGAGQFINPNYYCGFHWTASAEL